MIFRRLGIGIISIMAVLGGCALLSNEPVDPSAYILTYAMTTTAVPPPVSMDYGPEGTVLTSVVPTAVSWSVDVAMIDDHDNPFVPQLTAVGPAVAGLETLTLTIYWRRADAGLQPEILATQTYTNTTANQTIYGLLIP